MSTLNYDSIKEFDNSESMFDQTEYFGRVKHSYYLFGPW